MKVTTAFAQLFTVFFFLTLGSLLIIVSLHLLAFDDAILKLQEIYQSPWRSVQVGIVGLMLIILGIMYSKSLVKSVRPNEALIFQSEIGPMVVSMSALEGTALKAVKQFTLVKSAKVKVNLIGKNVELKLRLVLWTSHDVTSLLAEIQSAVLKKIQRLLGPENQATVVCDIKGFDETRTDHQESGDEH